MCTLIGTFGAKYITFDLKKYRGIIFHDTEESRKIWRKTDLCFQKWHEEYSPEHSESLKIGTLIGSFIQSRKYMSLKITRELCVMIVENDAKFEEELTYQFKIVMRNFTNFDLSTGKSKKFALYWLLLTKLYSLC